VEFADAGLKRTMLAGMAASTGGVYADYAEAGAVIERAVADAKAARHAGATVTLGSLWDAPLLLIVLLVLLVVEWLLRRRSGLA